MHSYNFFASWDIEVLPGGSLACGSRGHLMPVLIDKVFTEVVENAQTVNQPSLISLVDVNV